MPGYSIYRADHPDDRRKGGSAIFVKSIIQHDQLLPVREDLYQTSLIQIYLHNKKIKIGSFYSAPENRLTAADFWGIIHYMGSPFLLGGDFNSKHPRWGSNVVNPRGRILHDVAHNLSLDFLHPLEPTYYSKAGHTPDLLDFFLAKHTVHLCSTPSVHFEMSSDHFPVITTINSTPVYNLRQSLIKYPFDWTSYTNILNDITNLRISLKTPNDIDIAVSTLTRNIQYAANLASAKSETRTRRKTTISPTIIQLLREKKYCFRLWQNTKYPPHKTAYNRATRKLQKALQEERSAANNDMLIQLNSADGSLWKKVKFLTKQADGISPLHMNDMWYTTPQDKANLFSNVLKHQFQPNLSVNNEFTQRIMSDISIPLQISPFDIHFTPGQVVNIINRSPNNKAPGHDLIVQPLLRAFPRKTVVLLTQIFNGILRLAYFPQKWKHALIVMIPKPDKMRKDPNNYRPISLLPLFSKMFERLLLPKLLIHLKPLIPDTQFGFRDTHSCPQQLHRVVDIILNAYEQNAVCMGLFLDTEKAFDKVWHEGLLHKLKPILPDTYFRIIQSYLTKRTFSVKCENAQSRSKEIQSGVPQGSVLAPLLYLIYTSDFPSSDQVTIAQFADDVAILSTGTFESSATKLQRYVEQVEDWCSKWRVKMNPQKSTIVRFTNKTKVINYTVRLSGVEIPQAESVRYLGLTLDCKLRWRHHINIVVQRIRNRIRQLKFLLQGSSPLQLQFKKLIYLTVVRPIWTYGCGIWSSASNTQIKRVQTVQNRFLRLITNSPWYIRNTIIHTDLQIPEVTSVLRTFYIRLHKSFINHYNPLLRSIPQQFPPNRGLRRLKRKRHTDLLDP